MSRLSSLSWRKWRQNAGQPLEGRQCSAALMTTLAAVWYGLCLYDRLVAKLVDETPNPSREDVNMIVEQPV